MIIPAERVHFFQWGNNISSSRNKQTRLSETTKSLSVSKCVCYPSPCRCQIRASCTGRRDAALLRNSRLSLAVVGSRNSMEFGLTQERDKHLSLRPALKLSSLNKGLGKAATGCNVHVLQRSIKEYSNRSNGMIRLVKVLTTRLNSSRHLKSRCRPNYIMRWLRIFCSNHVCFPSGWKSRIAADKAADRDLTYLYCVCGWFCFLPQAYCLQSCVRPGLEPGLTRSN